MEQYHMKFGEKSHHLKRLGRKLKRSYNLCFRSLNLHSRVPFFAHFHPYHFFCPIEFF